MIRPIAATPYDEYCTGGNGNVLIYGGEWELNINIAQASII